MQHHFGGFKHKSETISITKMVNSENSSDLERVAATRSIAVEFSDFTILLIELQRCENTAFHFHAAPFGIRTPHLYSGLTAICTSESSSDLGDWDGRLAPDRLPMSFLRYRWPLTRYRGVKTKTCHVHATHIRGTTPQRPPESSKLYSHLTFLIKYHRETS